MPEYPESHTYQRSAGACVLYLNTEPKHSQYYDCPITLVMTFKITHLNEVHPFGTPVHLAFLSHQHQQALRSS
jgi:hypothetical protein